MGPLPAGFVGLVLPRSHAGKQGFFVIPGVIDADYTGIIKVQVWTHLPQSLPRGRSIAQLILVPYQVPAAEDRTRGRGGFGSTLSHSPSHSASSPLVALTMSVRPSKPQLTLLLNDVPFTGLVDTGADVTVIRDLEWPVSWPTVPSKELWGIGGSKPGRQSLSWVTVSKPGGRALATIRPFVLPLSRTEFDSLCHTSLPWQVALCDYVGEISYNPPKDPRLVITQKVPLVVHCLSRSQPIISAVTLFTDGSPHRGVVTYQLGDPPRWHSRFTLPQRSAQRSELAAVILAFQFFADCPFNLIVDTHYVYQVIDHLPLALITPQVDADLLHLFLSLQHLLATHHFPYFVAHIRSHTPLPGPLTEGNARADRALRGQVNSLFSDPIESHAFFHQSASVLARQFHIPADHARSIVRSCPHCAAAAPTFSYAVNPRGTAANQLWQMDVTHVPQFRPYSFLHVSVDTYSGFLWATPQRGEATNKVIHHLLACFSVMGRPCQIKTDNAPAYYSAALSTFCARWDVHLKHGIPYNSTGQAIVERANRTLKTLLDKQLKQGELHLRTLGDIQQQMYILLFTLNNLTLNADQQTPADRHFHKSEVLERPHVFYRQLPDPQWLGPAPLITWGRGYAAVSPCRTVVGSSPVRATST
ncbi:unnamed protein product [Lepidochelys kempii]